MNNKRKPILWLCLIQAITTPALAQEIPGFEIYLAELNAAAGTISTPQNITQHSGYDNQPFFSADGSRVFFTRQTEGQTDLFSYSVTAGSRELIQHSPESEYSPTRIPGDTGLSTVRVEADGKQRLWRFDPAQAEFDLLLPEHEPVGYHAWLDAQRVALFILGDSFTLHIATLGRPGSILVADNIGRTLIKHPQRQQILFVDKTQEPWQISAFDFEHFRIKPLLDLPSGVEDFSVDASGIFWLGQGSTLYRRSEGQADWQAYADLAQHSIHNITRLALHTEPARAHRQLIAIVSSEP